MQQQLVLHRLLTLHIQYRVQNWISLWQTRSQIAFHQTRNSIAANSLTQCSSSSSNSGGSWLLINQVVYFAKKIAGRRRQIYSLSPWANTQTYLFFTNSLAHTQAVCGSRSIHIKTDGGLPLINYSCARGNFFIIQVGNFSFSGGGGGVIGCTFACWRFWCALKQTDFVRWLFNASPVCLRMCISLHAGKRGESTESLHLPSTAYCSRHFSPPTSSRSSICENHYIDLGMSARLETNFCMCEHFELKCLQSVWLL